MTRRAVVWIVLAIVMAACGSDGATGTPTTQASPAASVSTFCGNGVEEPFCADAARVALAGVADAARTPTQVWIYSGELSPVPDLLFDPTANFPLPETPEGGTWIGSAEIAFAGSDEHAGLNIAQVGSKLVAVLVGYRTPSPGWCSGVCP